MVAVSQRYWIAGGKRIVQGVIKLFIDGGLVAQWVQFGFIAAVHRCPFSHSPNRCPRLELLRFLESLVDIILGDALPRIARLVQILLRGAIAHHAGVRGICRRGCHLRLGLGYCGAGSGN